ncbi:GNAT family N-acetyltransferase [Kitasatospora sp. NBC_00240]|uniref:GNAT family N-acetyltransferase n=1 Tax=Kitasatospora sp. NBC_00240 TaxID=2903567 RepID=UPI00225A2F0E|nr:GNAT family N-acetyltransferase [Kitasatospora sp. NBC_00240]MCX5207878.1 GNAT family N-acetyltransferase [Kitasatospora sp. NBC_00240]
MTTELPTPVRVAVPADIDALVATMTTAFFQDPLWGPVFPDTDRRAEQAGAMWRLYLVSALRYPWTFVTRRVESAAVWIPPGGSELTHEEEDALGRLLPDAVGRAGADEILRIFEQLDAARPEEPHHYLTLLGTHDDHRGKGLGMRLLAESLARIDALGSPAYLESSNPANDARYARAGFVPRDQITVPSGHVVTTMWRPARRAAHSHAS